MGANAQYRFYTPSELTPEVIYDLLLLVSVDVDIEFVKQWSRNELIVAADYALREHLRASDNNSVNRRDKPWFIKVASEMKYNPHRSYYSEIIPDPDQPGYNIGVTREVQPKPGSDRVMVNADIEVIPARGVRAEYGKGGVRIVCGDEHLTFLGDELVKLGITKIEMANYGQYCTGGGRITARGFYKDGMMCHFHASGEVCTHAFIPGDRTMFGEWNPS